MPRILNLPFMDLNSAAESVTLSAGLTFSGAMDQELIEEACDRIAKSWPILGARIRRNSETNKIEAIVPDTQFAQLKLTSKVVNATLSETEALYTKTETISTQVIPRDESLHRDQPLRDLEHYLSTDEPAFALHVAYLLDATIITLSIAHVLMDASGFTEFAKAFTLSLDGSPIPPLLPHDPWAILVPRALSTPDTPEARRGWTIWGAEQGAAYRQAAERDFTVDGPVQQRTIYFPAAEIARLKQEALDELHSSGRSIPFLSTNDIIVAWIYKHTFIDTAEVEKNRLIYVVDARSRFRDAFLPGYAYLQNAFFNMGTEPLSDVQLRSMSLGELAYMIRTSVQAQTTPEQLLSQLKWKEGHAGQTQLAFSPGDRMQWLSFGLGNLSIAKHIKQGSGTGQVLDVVYEVKGSARSCSAIKFKDARGGVVCDMDWGTKRWRTGEMAKYTVCASGSGKTSSSVPAFSVLLAKYSPSFQEELCKVLEQDNDAGKLDARGQFETLLQGPMSAENVTMPDGVVVVIDALDECEEEYGVRLILGVLLQHVGALPVRFFVTSRPEPAIRDPMSSGSGYSPKVLHLHDIELSIVEEDIKKYLIQALRSMSPPPTDDQIELLTKRAGKLFIYAATAVRYILPRKASTNPIERLNRVLTASPQHTGQGQSSKRYKELDELYTTILVVALDEEDEVLEEEERNAIRLVLRTVVCAREPMSNSTLATYLHLSETQVVFALESLRSVLHVSESGRLVSTLHASFPDYLYDLSRSKAFHCDPSDQNGRLAYRCFDIMKEQLRFNICDLESSFVFDKDVPNLEARIKSNISHALFYACLYAGDHLRLTSPSNELYDKLSDFLDRSLLFWMEVLNLKQRIAAGVSFLAQVERWLKHTEAPNLTYEHTVDARDFVSRFAGNACNRSTPHLYVSVLPFCVKSSFVYMRYWSRTKGLPMVEGTAMTHRNMSPQAAWIADSSVLSVAFSPDGACIVSGSKGGIVQVWDASSGNTIAGPLKKHTDWVTSVAFCPEGRCVVSGSNDHTMLLWDTYTGEMIVGPYTSHTKPITSVTFSPDGSKIASGSEDCTLLIWDTRTCEVLSEPFRGHTRWITCVTFSPTNEQRVASSSADKTIRVWDVRTGDTAVGPFIGHRREIYTIAFSPDGRRLVSGSEDCTIMLWDAHTGNIVTGPLTGHTDQVFSVAFSPDGTRIASGSIDATILLWAADSGEIVAGPFTSHVWAITSVMFSPDSTRLISGSFDRTIRLWSVNKRTTNFRPTSHSAQCLIDSVAFSPSGAYIASGSSDSTIIVWDTHTGDAVAGPFKHHAGAVSSIAFSPDGARIVSGSRDGTVVLWDVHTGDIVARPLVYSMEVLSVSFSPNSTRIFFGAIDSALRVWDVSTGDVIPGSANQKLVALNCVTFSPDGIYAAAASEDYVVTLWSTQGSNEALKRFDGHTAEITSVAFSPDSLHIASGSWDYTVHIWDINSDSSTINVFKGHTEAVMSVAFSSNGQRIASGSGNGTVLVWDAYTNNIVASLMAGHECAYARVAFSPDCSRIVTRYNDGSMRFWSPYINSGAPVDSSEIITWNNYATPPSDARTVSIATYTQARDHLPGTPTVTESELPAQDISTISQAVMSCTLSDNGWLLLDGAPVIWVPLELYTHLPYPHNVLTIGSQGSMYFTDELLSLGKSWRECYASQ